MKLTKLITLSGLAIALSLPVIGSAQTGGTLNPRKRS